MSFSCFRSYIYVFHPFWAYFCTWSEEWSSFILLPVAIQFSQHQVLKRLSFLPILYSCLLCHRLIDHVCNFFFLGSPFWVLLSLCLFFVLVPYCYYCSFLIQFEVWKCDDTSSFVLLSQDCFAYSGSLQIHKTLKIFLLQLWGKCH